MKNAVISIKIDPQLKKEAVSIAGDLGIPLATYLKMALKKLVREKKVSMELSTTPNPKNTVKWKSQLQDVDNKKNLSESFSNIEDFRKDLQS